MSASITPIERAREVQRLLDETRVPVGEVVEVFQAPPPRPARQWRLRLTPLLNKRWPEWADTEQLDAGEAS